MKITQFMLCLNAGGAERVAVQLSHDWLEKGHDVEIITLTGKDWPPQYELDPRIEHTELDLFGASDGVLEGLGNNLARIRALRTALKRSEPDVLVAQLTREIAIAALATWGLHVPVVGHHHSPLEPLDDNPVWNQLIRWAFGHVDRMVFLTEETRQTFPEKVRSSAIAIPNPIEPPPPVNGSPDIVIGDPAIVCVTGLRPVKDHQTLVDAFNRIADRFPDWKLVIVGEGQERERIEALIEDLDLDDRVRMTGFSPDPYEALHQAEIFALPSKSEGFSMALCEAMACGLPVVTTNSSDGQRLIVRDGVDGLLVPPSDPETLADALERLMANPAERQRMGKRAAEVVDRFSRESVFATWDGLLAEVVEEAR